MRRNYRGQMFAGVVAAGLVLLSGCSAFGSATITAPEARAELTALVDQVVDELRMEVSVDEPFFTPRECTRVTGQNGVFTATSVSGVVNDGTFRSDAVAAVLLAAGFELQRSDRSIEVFGRRDGMWVTATFEPRRGLIAIDANTGCRPS